MRQKILGMSWKALMMFVSSVEEVEGLALRLRLLALGLECF